MADPAIVKNRYDFVYLFDCQDGNPNGDPDFGNSPRVDPETLQGLVSDVCLKRKIRDCVSVLKSAGGVAEDRFAIFVMPGRTLESQQQLAYQDLQIEARTQQRNRITGARDWMCRNFFDVRTFGAVMSTTDFNCGQVRGPVQITFARSLDPVLSTDHCITRVTYTKNRKALNSRGRTEIRPQAPLPMASLPGLWIRKCESGRADGLYRRRSRSPLAGFSEHVRPGALGRTGLDVSAGPLCVPPQFLSRRCPRAPIPSSGSRWNEGRERTCPARLPTTL